ncbi:MULTISPECIES: BolA family protein [unclassified Methylophilus]|uniref:BolA family protein n=1 Tax=Methylophilus glucosoxydans TaxID=752553 RepID=A0ABW3GKJ3_9PROT|nr:MULTISPECIES: BolA family protein [unclassified Methylophilus]MBF5039708.1 BolA family transcriptional regulator [Methylophilus sp. 13]MDF0379147.1 BolA/IbaG family iron-sulfur metabolism protein [Methylophilus sp. YYY-1]MDT7848920.1 BolA family protein [Methylophilus sp. VKM B-3414]
MLTAAQLEAYIRNGLECDYLKVNGDDGTHFDAVIVSPAFEGKRMVQQHQLVYAALGDRMRAEIHALSMQTYTPTQWQQLQA